MNHQRQPRFLRQINIKFKQFSDHFSLPLLSLVKSPTHILQSQRPFYVEIISKKFSIKDFRIRMTSDSGKHLGEIFRQSRWLFLELSKSAPQQITASNPPITRPDPQIPRKWQCESISDRLYFNEYAE